MAGALAGITVIELAGIGPAPFAGMMLADHGARVIRVARPDMHHVLGDMGVHDVLNRNRECLTLDLKAPAGRDRLLTLVGEADALIEGNRPGVIERLGIGPEVLLAANPRLVIGRMTGWGQDGPLAERAGHDIDYIALSGALHTYGRKDGKPTMPVNAVGDYGGGGMMLAFAVLAGILAARRDGAGQVIDCAMSEGAALLTATIYGLFGAGRWQDQRESNVIDGGAPYYDTYETADRKWVAIGALEDAFYAELLDKLGLADDPDFARPEAEERWPELKRRLEALFRTKTRAEWCALLEDGDACFAPVLSLAEAPAHPHNVARGNFVSLAGVIQPTPAPRFSRTPAPTPRPPEA
ncbi:MAG: CoA transferase [Novosphingobium sp.]|nr:CoA transferase [Novosphingobium sp.]